MQSLLLLISYMDDQKFVANLDYVFFMFSFVTSSKLIIFLYRFIILLHLISSFSLTRSLLVLYAYVSVESIDCILLSSFELNSVLLISSVKTLCLCFLNLSCVFNNDLSIYRFIVFNFTFLLIIYFILNLSCFETVFIIFKFTFSFYDTLFRDFCFLSSLPLS